MSHSRFRIGVSLTPSDELLEMYSRSVDMCNSVSFKHSEHYRWGIIENELIDRGLPPIN